MDSLPEGVHWYEYGITAACIITSLVISLWIGKRGAKTVSNYILGNKNMPLWAIAMSHIASNVSSLSIIAMPAEPYYFGTLTMLYGAPAAIVMGLIQSYIFLPVLYKLQLGSLFEYCELRFNKKVRNLTSAINVMYELSQIAIILYTVSLVIAQIGRISSPVSTTGLMAICILYTSLGGFRGVIYNDSFQIVIIVFSFAMLLGLSFVKSGGMSSIVESTSNGNLFVYDTMQWDARHNVLTASVGYCFNMAPYFIGSAPYQRAISLPTFSNAQTSNLIAAFSCAIIYFLCSTLGLILHAVFEKCDPFNAKLTTKLDQLVPFFVISHGAVIPGVVGLFLSGLISAAFSTIAAYLNNSTAVVYKDFVQQWFKNGQSDVAARRTMQFLCVALGLICWVAALMLKQTKSILHLQVSLTGLMSSTIFAIFVIGLLLPRVNSKAILSALTAWFGVMLLLLINLATNPKPNYPTKNKRVDGCPFNVTSVQNSSIPIDPQVWNNLNLIHRFPSTMYSTVAFAFMIIVSLIASLWTRKGDENVDAALLWHKVQPPQRRETTENKVEILLLPKEIGDQ